MWIIKRLNREHPDNGEPLWLDTAWHESHGLGLVPGYDRNNIESACNFVEVVLATHYPDEDYTVAWKEEK